MLLERGLCEAWIAVGENVHLEVRGTETTRENTLLAGSLEIEALKPVLSSPGSLLCQLQPCPLRGTPGCGWLLPQGCSLWSFDFHNHKSIAQTLYLSLGLAIPVKTFLWHKGTGILCPARCFTLTLRALRIKCIVLLLKDLNVVLFFFLFVLSAFSLGPCLFLNAFWFHGTLK